MKKLNIAVIGQGRSGKDIHGKYYLSEDNKYFNVKYVVERDERRREISKQLYEGCEVLSDYKELFGKKDIDLVVNCTYSYMHYPITKDLIEHKFNVLTEKPFARNRYETDTLIKEAKENNVVLQAFQQTFLAPFYQDALRIIKDKVIGDVTEINIRYNAFARRWDWQTLQKKMGGNAYNTGPHPIGMALGFLDFDENTRIAYSKLAHTPMSSGDADDFCKIILEAPNKPLIDLEINNTDAYSDYNVKLQGTKGTFKCTPTQYEYTYIKDGENPEKPVIEEFLQDEEGNPLYCGEDLIKHTESGTYNGTAFDVGTAKLYEDLYYAITEGREMYVTPYKAGRIIGIIEQLHAANPLPLKY